MHHSAYGDVICTILRMEMLYAPFCIWRCYMHHSVYGDVICTILHMEMLYAALCIASPYALLLSIVMERKTHPTKQYDLPKCSMM